MNKVDLSVIPRKIYKGQECYDWKNSIGKIIPCTYNGIIGKIEIIKYIDGDNVKVKYSNKLGEIIKVIKTRSIKKTSIGKIIPYKKPVINDKNRFIDISELPTTIRGIDWINSVGKEVNFKYDELIGVIKILEYVGKGKMRVCCKNKEKIMSTGHFINCKLKELLSLKTSDFKLNIGLDIKNYKRDLTIIDKKRKLCKDGRYWKFYRLICNRCGEKVWMSENNILAGDGCGQCIKRYTASYMHSALLQYFKHIYPNTIAEHDIGFYGEKGIVSAYDIYVPELNLLIECQSEYHDGKEEFDLLKRQFAENKGYKFIALDCREYSPLEAIQYFNSNINEMPKYIYVYKDNKKYSCKTLKRLLKECSSLKDVSERLKVTTYILKRIINFYNLEIPKQEKSSVFNRRCENYYKVWELKRKGVTGYKISKELNINMSIVYRWLRENFVPKRELLQIEKGTHKILDIFLSVKEASDKTGINVNNIGNALSRLNKSAGGFIWDVRELAR